MDIFDALRGTNVATLDKDANVLVQRVADKRLKQLLERGVAFYHEGLRIGDRAIVEALFEAGSIISIVAEASMCWGMSMRAHTVNIMGATRYDGVEHRHVPYPLADMYHMMGRATSQCILMCDDSRKDFYKTFLFKPLPVESHLDASISDFFNAEIVARIITTQQEAVDWLTWTFYYRRLRANPNYYNMLGASNEHVSEHLSQLVEDTLGDLEESGCISMEEDELEPVNFGIIAAFYNLKCATIEMLGSSLKKDIKLRSLLEIVSAAYEFHSIGVRQGEDVLLREIARHTRVALPKTAKYTDVSSKVNLLLQCHFSRTPLSANLRSDQKRILVDAMRLLRAIVDVCSTNGWLNAAILAMECSQMVVQAVWNTDSPLRQIPHFTSEIIARCIAADMTDPFSILEVDDEQRDSALGLKGQKLSDVAQFCNTFPAIEMNFSVLGKPVVGEATDVVVHLNRDEEDEEEEGDEPAVYGRVCASLYPKAKKRRTGY